MSQVGFNGRAPGPPEERDLTQLRAGHRADTPADPHRWLEDVTGERQLAWARARSAESVKALAESEPFKQLEARIRSILDSKDHGRSWLDVPATPPDVEICSFQNHRFSRGAFGRP